MRAYEGPCFVASEGQEKRIDVRGRIIIDQESYFREHPTPRHLGELKPMTNIELCVCKQCTEIDLDGDNRRILLALRPGRMFGFALQSKVWGHFSLDKMSDPIYNEHAFERLILSQKSKQDLEAHMSAHLIRQEPSDEFSDFYTACKDRDFHDIPGYIEFKVLWLVQCLLI